MIRIHIIIYVVIAVFIFILLLKTGKEGYETLSRLGLDSIELTNRKNMLLIRNDDEPLSQKFRDHRYNRQKLRHHSTRNF